MADVKWIKIVTDIFDDEKIKEIEELPNKDLQAHHIIHWSDCKDNKDLRYATENGITLCRKCHLEAHGGSWR